MISKLVLVRHGQSQYNLENRFTGWQNVDITPTGIKEAEAAGEQLKSIKIDIAYTSKLLRAQHTLQIIQEVAELENIPVIEDKALNERAYGNLEGLNKSDTAEKYGAEQVHIWRRSFDVPPPGGESLKDTYERVLPYFQSHIKKDLDNGLTVLVVAHGNSLRALIMYLENLSPEAMLEREIAAGVPIIYEWPLKNS